MAAPGETYIYALTYLRVIFIAMPASMITVILSMGLRGGGDAATPLKFMVMSSVLDIGLNPLLINGFGPIAPLGIAGSALATSPPAANSSAISANLPRVVRMPINSRFPTSSMAGCCTR